MRVYVVLALVFLMAFGAMAGTDEAVDHWIAQKFAIPDPKGSLTDLMALIGVEMEFTPQEIVYKEQENTLGFYAGWNYTVMTALTHAGEPHLFICSGIYPSGEGFFRWDAGEHAWVAIPHDSIFINGPPTLVEHSLTQTRMALVVDSRGGSGGFGAVNVLEYREGVYHLLWVYEYAYTMARLVPGVLPLTITLSWPSDWGDEFPVGYDETNYGIWMHSRRFLESYQWQEQTQTFVNVGEEEVLTPFAVVNHFLYHVLLGEWEEAARYLDSSLQLEPSSLGELAMTQVVEYYLDERPETREQAGYSGYDRRVLPVSLLASGRKSWILGPEDEILATIYFVMTSEDSPRIVAIQLIHR